MYKLDAKNNTPLYIQLYEEIKKDILINLKADTKLPSIREISNNYNISKTTVENAYSQLYAEGYIDSRPQSGYFVSDVNYKDLKHKIDTIKPTLEKKQYIYDFYPARLDKNSFPTKLWKKLSSKAIDENIDFGTYLDGQGEFELRVQIASYLTNSRGANCDASQIVITSGFGESMQLLAKILQDKYNSFAIEDPGYNVARKAFEVFKYKIDKINVDENGIILDELKKCDSKIVYITPSHQYPKGVTMPISNRLKLLNWAKEVDGFILEDDYDSELSYYNRPIPCLQGLDTHHKVVYFGTFAKCLSPALRISYILFPQNLLDEYKKLFDIHFCKASMPTQRTLALFMKEGHFDRHLRKIRTQNKKKHDLLKKLLIEYLCDTMKIESDGAGLAILINPCVDFDLKKLKTLAEQNSIKLYFAKDVSGGSWEAIRMGFGGFSEEQLTKAIKAFSEIWYKCIKEVKE